MYISIELYLTKAKEIYAHLLKIKIFFIFSTYYTKNHDCHFMAGLIVNNTEENS